MVSPHFRAELVELIRNAHERLDAAKHLLTVSESDERKTQQVIASTQKAHSRLDAAARIFMHAIDEEIQGTDALFADEDAPIKRKVDNLTLDKEANPNKHYSLDDLILADDEEDLYESSAKTGPKFSSSLNIHLDEADLSYSAINKKTTKF